MYYVIKLAVVRIQYHAEMPLPKCENYFGSCNSLTSDINRPNRIWVNGFIIRTWVPPDNTAKIKPSVCRSVHLQFYEKYFIRVEISTLFTIFENKHQNNCDYFYKTMYRRIIQTINSTNISLQFS